MKLLGMVLPLLLGLLAGALAVHGRLAPKVAELTGQLDLVKTELARSEKQIEELKGRGRNLEKDLTDLTRKQAELQGQSSRSGDSEAISVNANEETAADASSGETADKLANLLQREFAELERGESEGDREREFESRMQDRMGSFFQAEYARATDSGTQDRIAMLQVYTDHIGQLRSAMRNAQTDQERDALRNDMHESFENVRILMMEQQDSMLRSVAAENGITDAAKQEALLRSIRQLQASPFFRPESIMMMDGGGGWGGGRGGRRGSR